MHQKLYLRGRDKGGEEKDRREGTVEGGGEKEGRRMGTDRRGNLSPSLFLKVGTYDSICYFQGSCPFVKIKFKDHTKDI